MSTRDMLEDLGVTVFEQPDMMRPAYWLEPERLVVIRPDAADSVWAEVADLAVMGKNR